MTTTATDPAIAWADKDIGVLMLTRKFESRLTAFKINTLGELSAALQNGQTFRLEPVEVTKIKSAFEQYMTELRATEQPANPPAEEPQPETGPPAEPEFDGKDQPGEPVGEDPRQAQAEKEFNETAIDAPALGLPPHVSKVLKSYFIDNAGELADRVERGENLQETFKGQLLPSEIDAIPICLRQLLASIERVCGIIHEPEAAVPPADPLAVDSFLPPQVQAAIEGGVPPAGATSGPDPALERAKYLLRTRADRELALDRFDIETTRLVTESEIEASKLWEEYEELHGKASLKKKEAEAADEELKKLIRSRAKERVGEGEQNLFSKPVRDDEADDTSYRVGKQEPENVGTVAPTPTASGGIIYPDTPDRWPNLWMEFPIEAARWGDWGLGVKDVEKLNAGITKESGTHPMATMGDVQRFITPNPANPGFARTIKDIKGFGEAAMKRWAEAELKFWAWWKNPATSGDHKGLTGQEVYAREKGLVADGNAPAGGSGAVNPEPVTEASGGGEPATIPFPGTAADQAGAEPGVTDRATAEAAATPAGKLFNNSTGAPPDAAA